MEISIVKSACINGTKSERINVEVSLNNGLPYYNVVGLADSSIKESRERVRSAIKNSGFIWPNRKITVNLNPAWLNKSGSSFDLAIALGILQASSQIPQDLDLSAWGELSLTGNIESVPAALALTDALLFNNINSMADVENGNTIFVIPENAKNEIEDFIKNVEYYSNLKSLVETLKTNRVKQKKEISIKDNHVKNDLSDLNKFPIDIQAFAWRACQIAVAGGHHLLMQGAAGSGKSTLARYSRYLLPELTPQENYKLALRYSIANLPLQLEELELGVLREVHHSMTSAAILGGSYKYPLGELALANKGILFLDEISLFPNDVINNLRASSESGLVERKLHGELVLQEARYILIATCNPCKCGNYFEESSCTCSDGDIVRYRQKFDNPFFDRISLFCNLLTLEKDKISETLAEREFDLSVYKTMVNRAREIQKLRFNTDQYVLNAWAPVDKIRNSLQCSRKNKTIFENIASTFKLSIRSYQNIWRLARTIADLDGSENIEENHIYEAFAYRRK